MMVIDTSEVTKAPAAASEHEATERDEASG
jgi:hypothetical protein